MEKITLQQMRYLHAIAFEKIKVWLRNHSGYSEVRTMEDAKIIVKQHFKIERISALSKKEASELIEELQRWCSEFFGEYLPDPNEPESYFNQPTTVGATETN
jgi:exoribonuclease R